MKQLFKLLGLTGSVSLIELLLHSSHKCHHPSPFQYKYPLPVASHRFFDQKVSQQPRRLSVQMRPFRCQEDVCLRTRSKLSRARASVKGGLEDASGIGCGRCKNRKSSQAECCRQNPLYFNKIKKLFNKFFIFIL